MAEEKLNLQLRFDAESQVVQRTMSVLNLLPRKKNYAVVIALDEFFQKYGLYDMNDKGVKKFIENYEYIRGLFTCQQFSLSNNVSKDIPDITPSKNIEHDQRNSNDKKTESLNAPKDVPKDLPSAAIIHDIPKKPENEPIKASQDVLPSTEDNAPAKEDPLVSSAQRANMLNLVNLFS